jgi:hypothetical protein
VEYLTSDAERDTVRRCATPLVAAPPERLTDIAEAWKKAR